MDACITLTTDFGARDAYVGIMKGVILSINPKASIIDICHNIKPQNIHEAAFVLGTAYRYFPKGSIHLTIVDPGVGSGRRAVILVTPNAFFVAPDNGVLSYVIDEASGQPFGVEGIQPRRLGAGLQAIVLSNPRFWLLPVSSTFHGRDIFAPVAAHLSLGIPPNEFGEATDSLLALPIPRPRLEKNGEIVGHVIHIDHFGNLITDVRRDDLPAGKVSINIAGHRINGLSKSYADGNNLLAIIGSSDRLEISLRNGDAAAILRAKVGDQVSITTL